MSGRLLLPEHSVTSLDVVHHADALAWLRGAPSNWLNCVVTSPPYYGLRDYSAPGQLGLEDTPEQYVARLVAVFREVRRVLRPDGVCWLNLGDSYAGSGRELMGDGTPSDRGGAKQGTNRGTTVGVFNKPDWGGLKPKDLIGIPWRVAFALQADGWYLRSDIIWHKPNPQPESVTDRPTKAHEYVFLLTKSERYWYDNEAIKEPSIWQPGTVEDKPIGSFNGKYDNADGFAGSFRAIRSTRNRRTVWTVPTEPKPFAHFAMFPQALIEPMVLAGCPAQVCAVCGAPYERVVEREPMGVRHSGRAAQMGEYGRTCTSGTMTKPPMTHTLGWRATCSCGAATRPGIVYDPFMGSGTTALVAQRLGRHFVGTDINREYVELARTRIRYRGDDRRMVREQEAGVEQLSLLDTGAA